MLMQLCSNPEVCKHQPAYKTCLVRVPYPSLLSNNLHAIYPKDYPIELQEGDYVEANVDIQTHKNIMKNYPYLYIVTMSKLEPNIAEKNIDMEMYDNSISIKGIVNKKFEIPNNYKIVKCKLVYKDTDAYLSNIPCIAFRNVAEELCNIEVGTEIFVTGALIHQVKRSENVSLHIRALHKYN